MRSVFDEVTANAVEIYLTTDGEVRLSAADTRIADRERLLGALRVAQENSVRDRLDEAHLKRDGQVR